MAKLGACVRLARSCALAAVAVAAVAVAAEPGLEARRIVEALRLGAGMVAADVGAGEGKFTGVLARSVGPSGRVYATEVAEDKLDEDHFADPKAMRRSLWAALRPGGQIAVIDVPPKKGWPRVDGAPERGGHGIEPAELLAEMRSAGFELVAHHEEWPAEDDSYCIVFRRPAER
jgi:predicted methyltransferase